MPLQPTDVPSRAGIQAAIDEAVDNHASTTDALGEHYDSGWLTLTLRGGFTGSAGEIPQIRRVGKIVSIRGRLTGTMNVGTSTVADVPGGFAPSVLNMWARAENSATNNGRMWVGGAGTVNVSPAANTTSTSVACTYMID